MAKNVASSRLERERIGVTLTSMTGFAGVSGGEERASWTWEARSVNGRGLDVRFRCPDGMEGLEAPLRAAVAKAFARGSVSIGLRIVRTAGGAGPAVNAATLSAVIEAALVAGEQAAQRGLDLAPMTAADLIGVRGVLETDASDGAGDPALVAAIGGGIEPLVAALAEARRQEGRALATLVAAQIDRIEALAAGARATAEARAARTGELLRARVEALLAAATPVDEARLAQELALLAVKADVTEELDRLAAHVAAARALVAGEGPVGRKLDFLMQEFNREANTLCSKSGSVELTAIGLEMKVVIDQMREQVQNVE